jgi:hypothetical protein
MHVMSNFNPAGTTETPGTDSIYSCLLPTQQAIGKGQGTEEKVKPQPWMEILDELQASAAISVEIGPSIRPVR